MNSIPLYVVTRDDSPVASGLPVSYEAAWLAARILNHEGRTDAYDIAPLDIDGEIAALFGGVPQSTVTYARYVDLVAAEL